MELLNYKIQVFGKVQGVWFRKYTKDKTDTLGVKGYVQNVSNGNVFIEVEATKDVLIKFVEWLYQGSPRSNVKEVIYDKGTLHYFKNFEIRTTRA